MLSMYGSIVQYNLTTYGMDRCDIRDAECPIWTKYFTWGEDVCLFVYKDLIINVEDMFI